MKTKRKPARRTRLAKATKLARGGRLAEPVSSHQEALDALCGLAADNGEFMLLYVKDGALHRITPTIPMDRLNFWLDIVKAQLMKGLV
jgi:hypothetical protein